METKDTTIKICGYEATYREESGICELQTHKGYVRWEKQADQVDHKPTQSLSKIEAHKGDTTKTFPKETHIMITLKKAMDWVQNSSKEQTPKQEETKAPEATQEVTEPIKEEVIQKDDQIKTSGNKDTDVKRDSNGRLIPGGKSLNPSGRPKGSYRKPLTELLKKGLGEEVEVIDPLTGQTVRITYGELMVRQMVKKAAVGVDSYQLQHVYDRIEGRPKEDVTIHNTETRELTIEERAELDAKLGL